MAPTFSPGPAQFGVSTALAHARSKAGDASRLRCGTRLLASACVLTIGTWLVVELAGADSAELEGSTGGPDGFERYQPRGIPARLPRVSYAAAEPPAYFVFCVLMPIGCGIIWSPLLAFLARIVTTARRLHLPPPYELSAHCFCFACGCCEYFVVVMAIIVIMVVMMIVTRDSYCI